MSAGSDNSAADVLAFWRAAGPDKWFKKDAAFDTEIASRFSALRRDAAAGALADWEAAPETALSLVLVLDQFPRNMFRGKADAFATDALARAAAGRAIARGFDRQVPASERLFFYLPFEHSESLADQERAVALMGTLDNPDLTRWAELHAEVIRRFGRSRIAIQRSAAQARARNKPSSTRADLPVEHRRTRS